MQNALTYFFATSSQLKLEIVFETIKLSKKTKREVMNTMKMKIKKGFEDNIRNSKAGVLSPLVVIVKSVDIN